MSEQAGEKSEQASQKRLEESLKKGQFARSAEVQTVFVLGAAFMVLQFTGKEMWNTMIRANTSILGHLGDISLTPQAMQGHLANALLVFGGCVGPVVLAGSVGALLAGGMQSRFNTATEALEADWSRVNPMQGFSKMFSVKALMPSVLGVAKLGVIFALCYAQLKSILQDPIFFTSVNVARVASFLADSASQIGTRVGIAVIVIASIDYGYQFWQTSRDMMMTKEEVKEEHKNTEGDPHMKARQRRRRTMKNQRQMLAEVPTADVVVTNPTHIAIVLRYDRKTMKAPKIVAKGTRLNALRIREIAQQHQVPIIENKPLARLMFKYGKVGGEVPAQLYAAVAEILAHVYRVNRYRYYAEQNKA